MKYEMMPMSSRILFSLMAISLTAGSHYEDYSKTHIFNPLFSAHAKFHVGQTLMFSILLALLTIFFAWRKTSDRLNAVLAVSSFAALYWVAQAGAILYPGTAAFDPQFITSTSYILGLPLQTYVEVIYLVFTGIAAWLALKPKAKWVS